MGAVSNHRRQCRAQLPTSLGPLMARSGRLVWIKSVLSAMPLYAMLANGLPPWFRKEITICRRFFWAGKDDDVCGKCMVAWPSVCMPTDLGWLGVINLRLASIMLQARWLWLQQVDTDRAWAELPIKVAPEVIEGFHLHCHRQWQGHEILDRQLGAWTGHPGHGAMPRSSGLLQAQARSDSHVGLAQWFLGEPYHWRSLCPGDRRVSHGLGHGRRRLPIKWRT